LLQTPISKLMEEHMKSLVLRLFAASTFGLCVTSPAHAGIFRAYLSQSGNDANPCTVVQPCRLLPAAISAVSDGGEIWMLDSANYNTSTVSIGKSVSILAVPGALGSIAANGSDAISINAPSSNVSLRNIKISPVSGSGGGDGIVIASVGHLAVEDSVFENLQTAISVAGAARLSIRGSTFRTNFMGLDVEQTGGASQSITIDHTSYLENVVSLTVLTNSTTGNVRVSIDNSEIRGGGNGNGTAAFGGAIAGAAPINVSIMRTKIAGNGIGVGISAFGAQTIVALGECHLSGWPNGATRTLNGQSGVGVVQSLGNNFYFDSSFTEITGTITPR